MPAKPVAARDGRESAQARDAPSSADPWTTEKRRAERGIGAALPRPREGPARDGRAGGRSRDGYLPNVATKTVRGPPGVCWRCRRPCTSKVSCSRRGSGAKRFVACDSDTSPRSRRQQQDRNVTVARKRAPTDEAAARNALSLATTKQPRTQVACGKIETWRSRCTQRSYIRGLALKTPAARSKRGGRAQARSYG